MLLDLLILLMLIVFIAQIPFILLEKEIKIGNFILFGDNRSIDIDLED